MYLLSVIDVGVLVEINISTNSSPGVGRLYMRNPFYIS